MTATELVPNMPAGVFWDHTTVSATAYLYPVEDGYQTGHLTVEVYFDVVPGTLPDAQAYSSSRWHFRPTDVRARYSDGKLEKIDVSGQRVLKNGGMAQRQPQTYNAYSGECKRMLDGEDTNIPGGTVIAAALAAYLVAHPLPTLALSEAK